MRSGSSLNGSGGGGGGGRRQAAGGHVKGIGGSDTSRLTHSLQERTEGKTQDVSRWTALQLVLPRCNGVVCVATE
jgi:hypothetical protein